MKLFSFDLLADIRPSRSQIWFLSLLKAIERSSFLNGSTKMKLSANPRNRSG